jgi:hypothetical protein
MALSAYLRDRLLDHYLKGAAYTQPTNVYVSLHTGDPGTTGASEVAGGSYARQLAAFAAASGGSKATNAIIDFAGMPAVGGGGVTHAGFWDAVSGGNFLSGGPLAASKVVNAGDTFRLPSGQASGTLS